ncbi:YciI family protein [Nigerium massiliense]|uniref:YciI family protein n=1 Tax=Nigerium massiliense TaxID=1522317 RepID=UPI00058B0395|nr:YciI family protein [Nigerium massiliense]
MKFVILIHSNPQPWAHPTSEHTREYAALPQEKKDQLSAHWDEVYGQADANGEIVYGCPLGDPNTARVFHYTDHPMPSDGPYAETKEHLAGFFVIDVDSQERAEQIAEAFSCPGDTVELRPVMRPGDEA